jgi:hypothetical protein
MSLNVLDIIELRSQWVIDVNGNDFPVCFFLVQKSHHTKYLDLLDLTCVSNGLPNLAHVEWVIITFRLSLGMNDVRVFPCLVID